MQDLVSRPFARLATSSEGKFATGIRSFAVWQARICDLAACLSKTHLDGIPVQFNLELTDPIAEYIDPAHACRGVAGEYIVTLGPESKAERGTSPKLPTLTGLPIKR